MSDKPIPISWVGDAPSNYVQLGYRRLEGITHQNTGTVAVIFYITQVAAYKL